MFSVPFNKKRISDSTAISSQELGVKLEQQQHNHHHNLKQQQLQLHNKHKERHSISNKLLFTNFYLGSTNLLNKIFIKSLASIRRCLHISLRTLLAILNSITSQCTQLLISSSGVGGEASGNLNSSASSLLNGSNSFRGSISWLQPLAVCSAGLPTSLGGSPTTGYLRAIAEASNWSEAAATAIGVATSLGTGAQNHRNETIYYETISGQPQSISTAPLEATAATLSIPGERAAVVAEDPYQCDTIEMDFCRRRITQRAASNNKSNPQSDVGSPANTVASSYYWDYSMPAVAGTSSTQTCTSVGPQVSGENKAARELCRQLRRDQVRPQFQGQQEQGQEEQQHLQQRSYGSGGVGGGSGSGSGLQTDMGNSRRECPQQQQQQQIILLQSGQQEQRHQRSLHDAQISNSSQYPHVAQSSLPGPQSSSSFNRSASFMSAHQFQHNHHYNLHNNHHLHNHQQQRHKQQDGPNNGGSMISNDQSRDEEGHQKHQLTKHEAFKDQQQDATADVVGVHGTSSMVLISKDTISNLTDQIALSMNKMKELEERVRVIPELQRRLDNVISDSNSSSVSDSNHHLTYIGSGGRNNSNHNNGNYLNNHQSHNSRQDLSFSTDNVAPYFGSGCNSNSFSMGSAVIHPRSNNSTNRATYSDELFRGIHPSLQRHYNSFRCSTNNNNTTTATNNSRVARDASCFSIKDSVIATQSTGAGNYGMRSSFTGGGGGRDVNCNNGCAGTASLTNNHHNNNSSRQSLPMSASNMQRSNQNLNTNRSSSPKVEYEDLINDLLSLSYSVNYPSSTTNSSQNQTTFSSNSGNGGVKRPHNDQQVKETQANINKSSGHDQQQAGSKRSSPSLSKLDCGCQSFKEHLRYNSISREQRMQQHTRSQSVSYNHHHNSNGSNITSATSLQSTPTHGNKTHGHSANNRQDASTNTDLSMDDIVTRVELNNLVSNIQKTYSTLSSIASRDDETTPSQFRSVTRKSSSSFASGSTSGGSLSGHKSSSPHDIRSTDSCDDNDDEEQMRNNNNDNDDGLSEPSNCESSKSNKGSLDENDNHPSRSQASDADEEELEVNHSDGGSLNGDDEEEGPFSLGSSYQDPSDFEEYCAYGESLDRRTKDFMSQSTKIPNDLRFALIRLNDFLKRNRSYEQIESTSGCIEVIRKEWFEVAASKDSQPAKTKLYVDYFESFTKQLLNTVVNLCDSAGNTAMHYAASLFKLDIIKVLLDTKVCDINCRNKAGYTPIMLLGLADILRPDEQEIARQLFSMGDVNIKARTNGQTAIMLAASHGRISTCKLLLECGADPSLQDFDGSTALMCGSEIGNEEVVRCLLAHKLTDPNAVDNDGLDALSIAMNNGHKNIGLILYAAKNVPRMVRSVGTSNSLYNSSINSSGYLGASLRRSRGKVATNFVRRADSLLGSRSSRLAKHSQT